MQLHLLNKLCCTSLLLLQVMSLCACFANSILKVDVLKLSFDRQAALAALKITEFSAMGIKDNVAAVPQVRGFFAWTLEGLGPVTLCRHLLAELCSSICYGSFIPEALIVCSAAWILLIFITHLNIFIFFEFV